MKSLSNLGTRLYVMHAVRKQKGAAIIEYVLLTTLIGVALIVAFGDLKTAISGAFTTITNAINPV